MAKLDKLVPNQVLWTVSRGRMGNTMITTVYVHEVRVIEVNTTEGYVVASWNSNPARKFYEGEVSRWKVKEPVTVSGAFGSVRLARKDEKAAILAKRQISTL